MQNRHRKCIRRAAMVIRHITADIAKLGMVPCIRSPDGYRDGIAASLRHVALTYEGHTSLTIDQVKRLAIDTIPTHSSPGERTGIIGGLIAGLSILNEIAAAEGVQSLSN